MGAESDNGIIRCYYIANGYDGAYFVLTDNKEEYAIRLGAYLDNLITSPKTNHYNFGSVEMTRNEYEGQKTDALALEREHSKSEKSKGHLRLV